MSDNIQSVLNEVRVFPPPETFSTKARISSLEDYQRKHAASIADPEAYWASEAAELTWHTPWTKVLEWNRPDAKWFVGATTNIAENCLDRHVAAGKGDKVAILWEGEPGDSRRVTYGELHQQVSQFANVLLNRGIKDGDRVLIYMPMVPEAAVAMLACARIGAIHSVVFGGFSSESIRDRLIDSEACAVITADGGWRRGKIVALKENVDLALKNYDGVKHVFVFQRGGNPVSMVEGRDLWWHDEMATASTEHVATPFDSEHPLFILYTSGSTGKPKGIMHTTGGYMVGTYATSKYIFDMHDEDVFWCTADVGWITGHSYIVYGPMLNGVSQVMYEGAPNFPDWDRFWAIIAKYKVSIFYTAPTAIRSFIRSGDEHPARHDLSSLRLLGSVGEPINPEAWMWYHNKIGGGRCPIVDTWWQTETGAIMISPIPGAIPTKPGTATLPFFGIDAAVVDNEGKEVLEPDEGGILVIRKPWPSMLRTIYKNPDRYVETYWQEFENKGGYYLAGDGAHRDKDGYFWIMGRLDDVLNVSGHRLGTAEVESALVSHPSVAEAAVVGRPDEIKGQAVVAFVTVKGTLESSDALALELRNHVGKVIGAIAKPDEIRFAAALPKTRSGKIMRRLLKEICSGGAIKGDTTTLEDVNAVHALMEKHDTEG